MEAQHWHNRFTVSQPAAGMKKGFNSGKDASRQSTAHISALYSGGNAGGRNRHGNQGHQDNGLLNVSINVKNAHA